MRTRAAVAVAPVTGAAVEGVAPVRAPWRLVRRTVTFTHLARHSRPGAWRAAAAGVATVGWTDFPAATYAGTTGEMTGGMTAGTTDGHPCKAETVAAWDQAHPARRMAVEAAVVVAEGGMVAGAVPHATHRAGHSGSSAATTTAAMAAAGHRRRLQCR